MKNSLKAKFITPAVIATKPVLRLTAAVKRVHASVLQDLEDQEIAELSLKGLPSEKEEVPA